MNENAIDDDGKPDDYFGIGIDEAYAEFIAAGNHPFACSCDSCWDDNNLPEES
jgi:hypothetical protein